MSRTQNDVIDLGQDHTVLYGIETQLTHGRDDIIMLTGSGKRLTIRLAFKYSTAFTVEAVQLRCKGCYAVGAAPDSAVVFKDCLFITSLRKVYASRTVHSDLALQSASATNILIINAPSRMRGKEKKPQSSFCEIHEIQLH